MELLNARLILANEDSIPLRAVTPAEAMVLVAMHTTRAKKHPLVDVKVIGSAQSIDVPGTPAVTDGKGQELEPAIEATYRPRTKQEEMARLRTKYHKKFLEPIFPSPTSPMPETFADAEETWKQVENTNVADGQVGNWTDMPGVLPKQADGVKIQIAPKTGPTIEQWLAGGHLAGTYPPEGFAEVPSEGLTRWKESQAVADKKTAAEAEALKNKAKA